MNHLGRRAAIGATTYQRGQRPAVSGRIRLSDAEPGPRPSHDAPCPRASPNAVTTSVSATAVTATAVTAVATAEKGVGTVATAGSDSTVGSTATTTTASSAGTAAFGLS